MKNSVRDANRATPVVGILDRSKTFLLILFAALLPYVSSLRYGFVYDDDVQVLGNPTIVSWRFVSAYFTKPIAELYAGMHSAHYYRPIFLLWLRVNYFLWGANSRGWHLTNLLLHAATSLLVLLVLRKYFQDLRWATVGALVFAVHPAHLETVAWVSGCTDSLMALSLLGSFYLWMDNCDRQSVLRRIGSAACFAVALCTKETAVILPVIIFLHALLGIPSSERPREKGVKRLNHALWEAIPYIALTAAYATVHFLVLRGVPSTPKWISSGDALLTVPALLLFYIRHLVWPASLSLFYDSLIVRQPSDYLFWGPQLLLGGLFVAGGIWYGRKRDERIIAAGLWFLLPLVPVLYVSWFKRDDFVHDRYLYLPVLALSILIGMLAEFLSQLRIRQRELSFPLMVPGAVVVSLALATVAQVQPWQNNLALYRNAVRVAPNNGQARNNLAAEDITEGRYDDANDLLIVLLKDQPDQWLANYNYGFVNYRLGKFSVAEEYLRRAIRLDPTDSDQYIYLGTTYLKEGRLHDAEEQVRQGITRKSDGVGYHIVLGVIKMQEGDLFAARDAMSEELRYHPESQAARAQLRAISVQLQAR